MPYAANYCSCIELRVALLGFGRGIGIQTVRRSKFRINIDRYATQLALARQKNPSYQLRLWRFSIAHMNINMRQRCPNELQTRRDTQPMTLSRSDRQAVRCSGVDSHSFIKARRISVDQRKKRGYESIWELYHDLEEASIFEEVKNSIFKFRNSTTGFVAVRSSAVAVHMMSVSALCLRRILLRCCRNCFKLFYSSGRLSYQASE